MKSILNSITENELYIIADLSILNTYEILYLLNIQNFVVQKMFYFAESHLTVNGVDGKTFNGKTHFLYWEINS